MLVTEAPKQSRDDRRSRPIAHAAMTWGRRRAPGNDCRVATEPGARE